MKTVKELAEELNVTPQTIRNVIRREDIVTAKLVNAKGLHYFALDDESEKLVKQALLGFNGKTDETDFAAKIDSKTAKDGKTAKEQQNLMQNEIAELQEKLVNAENQLQNYSKMITAKDELILSMQETIRTMTETHKEEVEKLSDTISTLSSSLQAAQALHAGTLQQIAQHDDKKWWQFWKRG